MRLLLRLLDLPLPEAVRCRLLGELFDATADAFECPRPDLRGLPFDERLRRYAILTREEAERCLRAGGDVEAVRRRLHENARRLGAGVRRLFGVADVDAALAAGQSLYRVIGIDLEPGVEGALTIRHCYFAGFYPAAVCRLISALDEGLFHGLSDGGQLRFSERITEGCDACRARLVAAGAAR